MSTPTVGRCCPPRVECWSLDTGESAEVSGPSITGDVPVQFTANSCVTVTQPAHTADRLSDGGAAAAKPAVRPSAPEHDEYEHLIPLQRRYAELARDDPDRRRWRDQLISGYLPVAEHIARRFSGRGEPLDDLVQVATVGLINAVDRFEPARGSNFLSFAVPTITGEVRR